MTNLNETTTECGDCKCNFNLDVALNTKTGLDTTNSDCFEYSNWYLNEKEDDYDLCYNCFYFDSKCSSCTKQYNNQVELEKEATELGDDNHEDFEYNNWYFYNQNKKNMYFKLKNYKCLCYDCFTTHK
jgi:hypothetical protein